MHQSSKHSLTLSLQHQYFYEKIFRSAQVEITAETRKLLHDLQLVAKPFPGGLRMMAFSMEALQQAEQVPPLRFYVRCNDPQYINYTDIPGELVSDHLLYFSNSVKNKDDTSGAQRLHSEDYAGQAQSVPVVNSKVTIPISVKENQQLSLLDAADNELPEESMNITDLDPLSIVLNHQEEGLYQLSIDGKDNHRFYQVDKPVWRKPLAIVELFPGKLLEDFQDAAEINYEINFNNRETIWKYFLVSPEFQKFKKLSIINKGREPVFKEPQKTEFPGGSEGLMFESLDRLPLSEVASHTFQLVDNYDPEARKGKVILKNLNKASPEMLFMDDNNSNEPIYSHIYI